MTTIATQEFLMQHQTTIAQIKQKTPNVKSFVLDCGDEQFNFFAGQWVDIHRTINDESHNCGYSITSIPSNSNTIEIAVKLAPNLLLTRYLHEDCKVGDKIFISHAQGDIWINDDIKGPYVFIGGGVGITPLYSMIKQILNAQSEVPVVLLYSITGPDEFLFKDEIAQLEKSNPNFKCYVTVTKSEEHNFEFSGRISKSMLTSVNLPANASYYLCGPPQMVDAVANLLEQLKSELQLNTDNIFYDRWWA